MRHLKYWPPMQIDIERNLRRARRQPMFDTAALDDGEHIDRSKIEGLIPHRGAFLLLDRMTVQPSAPGIAWGIRRLAHEDPVFGDHFPGTPIYPGVLLVEAMAQLSLAARAWSAISGDAEAMQVRLLRIADAAFVNAAFPGDEVRLLCCPVEDNGFTFSAIGQALRGDEVLAVTTIEAMEVEQ